MNDAGHTHVPDPRIVPSHLGTVSNCLKKGREPQKGGRAKPGNVLCPFEHLGAELGKGPDQSLKELVHTRKFEPFSCSPQTTLIIKPPIAAGFRKGKHKKGGQRNLLLYI